MLVDKNNYPSVFEVFEIISHDRGSGAGHSYYAVPDEWAIFVKIAETELLELTAEERETFAIGEETEAEAIGFRSINLIKTHAFLNAFFNEFAISL